MIPLEGLDFKDSFVVLLVSGLQLPPSMNIHRVFQFVLQSFNFGPLIKEFLLLEADFSLEIIDASNLRVDGKILIPEGGKFKFELSKLLRFLLAVDVAFDEVGVGKLDLFVKN